MDSRPARPARLPPGGSQRLLERTGDYPGLGMLRYYPGLPGDGPGQGDRHPPRPARPARSGAGRAPGAFLGYLGLAEGYAADGPPEVLADHAGPLGASADLGWPAASARARLRGATGALRRRAQAPAEPRSRAPARPRGLAEGLYTPEMTRATLRGASRPWRGRWLERRGLAGHCRRRLPRPGRSGDPLPGSWAASSACRFRVLGPGGRTRRR